ncbi:alpha/beta hydrolase [Serratia sp. Tan611]|uniref:alpha/beta hydrolase n=1 Tax=Serratia sp. Tan611 TaxID=2773264 RepID=UPI0019314B63|nr:alpha/beta hydrolase [Serratia sp. Tan611]MBU3894999.1 lysophospholipase [Serratia rubidaea]CAE1142247.1 Lysophospholipase [Serratia sp. Tan611]
MSQQQVSFIKGQRGDIALHDWQHDAPRFLALLVHGYGEHLGRYHYVARTLQDLGARVFGPDHLGHGLSQGERVLIEDYEAVVDDVRQAVGQIRRQHPDLPLVVIGHSMGGMIATRYVQRFGDDVRALVLSGPLLGEHTAIGDLQDMETIPDTPLDVSTLSRDPAVGVAYQADPLVWHGPFKRPTLQAIRRFLATIDAGPGFGALPTLWLHGGDDRLVLSEESRTTLERLRGSDFHTEILPGARHEIFHEIDKDRTLQLVSAFIQRTLR